MLRTLLLLTTALLWGHSVRAQEGSALRAPQSSHGVKGIEKGENGFRHRTPTLNRANVRHSYVNAEELASHKQSIYALPSGGVATGSVETIETSENEAEAAPVRPKKKPNPAHGDPWPWVGGILAVMGFFLFLLVRATGRAPPSTRSEHFVITSRSS